MSFQSYKVALGVAGVLVVLSSAPLALAQQQPPRNCRQEDVVGSDGARLIPLRSETIHTPDSGQEATVEVGQSMISSVRGSHYPTSFRVESPIQFSADRRTEEVDIELPRGDLSVHYNTPDLVSYIAPMAVVTNRKNGKLVPRTVMLVVKNRPAEDRLVWTKGMKAFGVNIPDAAGYSRECINIGANGFRRELVYSGTSKGSVSLLYREFSNDMARPAFSQELTYDLSEGDEIGFRGARFKVLKATNTSIRYLVLKPLADG